MKKNISRKIVLSFFLSGILLSGCTTSTELVRNQSQEIINLQGMRKKILERPAFTSWQRLEKEQDLKMINEQIEVSMNTARNAQNMSNEQTRNMVSGVVTTTGVVLGTALVIHKITN